VAAGPNAVSTPDAIVKEICRLEDAWAAAEVKRDGAAVGELLAEGFLFTDPEGALHTKAQLVQTISTSTDERISEIGSDYQVKVYGDSAVIHGVVTLVDKVGSGTRQVRLRFTDTWAKQADGQWRCVAAQSAVIRR
jgi:ketosteroid isomerase-like protein